MHKLSRIANEALYSVLDVGVSASCRRVSILRVVTKYLELERLLEKIFINTEY